MTYEQDAALLVIPEGGGGSGVEEMRSRFCASFFFIVSDLFLW